MRYIDILAYGILTIATGYLTYTFIASNNTYGMVIGAAATMLWAVNLFIRLFKHK